MAKSAYGGDGTDNSAAGIATAIRFFQRGGCLVVLELGLSLKVPVTRNGISLGQLWRLTGPSFQPLSGSQFGRVIKVSGGLYLRNGREDLISGGRSVKEASDASSHGKISRPGTRSYFSPSLEASLISSAAINTRSAANPYPAARMSLAK
jgi:hypothetical protein